MPDVQTWGGKENARRRQEPAALELKWTIGQEELPRMLLCAAVARAPPSLMKRNRDALLGNLTE